MTTDELENKLKEILVERLFLELSPEEIQSNVELGEYGVDSFLLLELIVALEEEFGVKFEQSDITADALKTIASLGALVSSKMNS